MSNAQCFAILAFLGFSCFYFYHLFAGVLKHDQEMFPGRMLERPRSWVEKDEEVKPEPEMSLASRFGDHISRWQGDNSMVVSYRFFAGLVMFSLWIHLFD